MSRTVLKQDPSRPVTRDVTVVRALSSSLQTKSHYAEPEDFDEWLAWLDETSALVRQMAIDGKLNWHRDQLAYWAQRAMEEWR